MSSTRVLGRHAHGMMVAAGIVLGVAAPCGLAFGADKPDPLNDTWEVSFGLYSVDTQSNVSLDGTAGDKGTKINWDKNFGGGSLARFRFDGQWRFAERHKLQASWFNSSNSRTRTIDTSFDWGGVTYPVGAKVKGDLNYDIYMLDYEYAFLRRESYEVSASIGAYYAKWDAKLSADFTDPGGPGAVSHSGTAKLNAPLPVLGLHGRWALPYDLVADLSGRWFYLSVNQYSGSLQDYMGILTWQPKAWLGIGVGYDWFLAHGDVNQSDFKGSLDWNFNGPMIFYRASF